jgi:endopeptidase La
MILESDSIIQYLQTSVKLALLRVYKKVASTVTDKKDLRSIIAYIKFNPDLYKTRNERNHELQIYVFEDATDEDIFGEMMKTICVDIHSEIVDEFMDFFKYNLSNRASFRSFVNKAILSCGCFRFKTKNTLVRNDPLNKDVCAKIDRMTISIDLGDVISNEVNTYFSGTTDDPDESNETVSSMQDETYIDADQSMIHDDDESREMFTSASSSKKRKSTKPKKHNTRSKSSLLAEFKKLNEKRISSVNADSDFGSLTHAQQETLVAELKNINEVNYTTITNTKIRIMLSNLSTSEKRDLISKSANGYGNKFDSYLNQLLSFPFGKYAVPKTNLVGESPTAISSMINESTKILDSVIYGQQDAKRHIMRIIAQNIANPSKTGNVLGLVGPKGIGKTKLVKDGICKVLGLPFVLIPLAGLRDSSFFSGHSYTYEGSQPGRIVSALQQADVNVLNPVIFCDELDKISRTDHGTDIMNKLIFLTDPIQNRGFQDNYFGAINIDLSRATWIFTWNDTSKIDPILVDRINVIELKGYTAVDKIEIAQKFLIPDIRSEFNLSEQDIDVSSEVVDHLINNVLVEGGGVRKLRQSLVDIVSEFNLKKMTQTETVENLVTLENLTTFFKKENNNEIKINDTPVVGHINGLYTTSNENGGIIPISAKFIPSLCPLELTITGNLGKIMKESCSIAKTLAVEKTSYEFLSPFITKKNSRGIHIHCSEGSVGKEGPSAGTAIAVCIYSLLNNIPIRNDVAVTGEIDLNGHVTKIGGLRDKIFGARRANCKKVLFPISNLEDFNKICKNHPSLFKEGEFEAIPIRNFKEAIDHLCIIDRPILSQDDMTNEDISCEYEPQTKRQRTF